MEALQIETRGIAIDRREVGRLVGKDPGPTLIIVAGIHGNEPAGIEAARRVLARLSAGDLRIRGELFALAGNLEALRLGVRYQAKDLNRLWSETQIGELREKRSSDHDAEDREQLDLLASIESAIGRARGRVHLADLHTTSAAGIPFILFGDTLEQRRFARGFPLPAIIGLEEQLDAVLTDYWTRRGCTTLAIEGGQHASPDSIDAIEAFLWLALARGGLLEGDVPAEVARSTVLLDRRRAGLPRVVEVISRRSVSREDGFRMEPGFRNIDRARKGQLLARDRSGEIRAPADGLVILPLYQGLGRDGFFWGRELGGARLLASEALRSIGAERLLGLVPGVVRESGSKFVVDARATRPLMIELLHFFGYRRIRENGDRLVAERQGGAN
ncbi:MAG TPA: succinylglutamate desuccinylase/aspartoacylase family protein [Myxococcales bacterium]|nr:succinylglutamate desuccinylase/aspartoacylase family protein [Myxococcales bacterium]